MTPASASPFSETHPLLLSPTAEASSPRTIPAANSSGGDPIAQPKRNAEIIDSSPRSSAQNNERHRVERLLIPKDRAAPSRTVSPAALEAGSSLTQDPTRQEVHSFFEETFRNLGRKIKAGPQDVDLCGISWAFARNPVTSMVMGAFGMELLTHILAFKEFRHFENQILSGKGKEIANQLFFDTDAAKISSLPIGAVVALFIEIAISMYDVYRSRQPHRPTAENQEDGQLLPHAFRAESGSNSDASFELPENRGGIGLRPIGNSRDAELAALDQWRNKYAHLFSSRMTEPWQGPATERLQRIANSIQPTGIPAMSDVSAAYVLKVKASLVDKTFPELLSLVKDFCKDRSGEFSVAHPEHKLQVLESITTSLIAVPLHALDHGDKLLHAENAKKILQRYMELHEGQPVQHAAVKNIMNLIGKIIPNQQMNTLLPLLDMCMKLPDSVSRREETHAALLLMKNLSDNHFHSFTAGKMTTALGKINALQATFMPDPSGTPTDKQQTELAAIKTLHFALNQTFPLIKT